MREIKFRGRSDVNNVWHYGDLATGKSPAIVEGDIYTRFFYVDPATVGEFTGLRDADGHEIYEGDILDIDGDFIAEVVYCDGAYELYTKQGPLGKLGDIAYEYSLAIVAGVIETFSVIGNVHDNPQLLKEGGGNA